MKNSQILTAETLGMINHEQGNARVPAQSKELMGMIEHGKNEVSTVELMKAWMNGWDKARRVVMKSNFGF